MSKFSEDVIKLFEIFKKEVEDYQDLNLEEVEFEEKSFDEVLETVSISPIVEKQILPEGKYPVVSPKEKLLISGYHNDESKFVNTIPVIVFGDHNCVVKYVNFSFIPAGNIKVLKVIGNENFYIKYIFYQILYNAENIKTGNYQRHYSLLREKLIYVPKTTTNYTSYQIQKAIADFIEFISLKSDDIVNLMEEITQKAEKGKENLLCKIFENLPNGEITDDVVNLFNEFKEEKKYDDLNLEEVKFEEKKLIDFGGGEGICKQRMGFTPKTTPDGDIYFFKVGDLSKVEGLEIIEPQTEEMTKMEYVDKVIGKKSKKRTPIKKGEILVSFKLTVGVAKIYNSDKLAYCNEAIDILTPKEGYYNKYLAMIVGEKYKEQANSETVKGKSLNEDLKKLIYIPIPKPFDDYSSYQIQKIIAEFIEFSFENYLKLIQKIRKESDLLEKHLIRKFFDSIISNKENE